MVFHSRPSIVLRFVCSALVVVLCGGTVTAAPVRDAVRVSLWTSPPMGGFDRDGRPSGFVVDALNAAAGRARLTLDWVVVGDAAQNDEALQRERIDIAVGYATDDRRRAFFVTEPWWSVELVALVPADSAIHDESGLRHRRVGVPASLGEDVPLRLALGEAIPAPNAAGVAATVCRGDADAGIVASIYLPELLFANAGVCANARMRTVALSVSHDYVLLASRASEAHARSLRQAIDAITEDGTLSAIAARHPPVSTPHASHLAELLAARSARRSWRATSLVATAGAGACLVLAIILARGRRQLSAANATLRADIRAREEAEAALRALERDRQRLEHELLHVQKMESVGRLAGGVAHDFNNLLTVQIGYCDIVRQGLRGDDPLAEPLNEIAACAERAAGLTSQLLAFSRRQTLQPVVFDLDDRVRNLMKMLRRLIGEDLDMVLIEGPGALFIKADPGQVDQVVINLAVNARDAMPDGGRLTLRLEADPPPPSAAAFCLRPPPIPAVALSVEDTGCGMDADTVHHVFEPFFTTKAQGKGTGLGLSTVYGIVMQSGGTIAVRSTPGAGSTFTVYLPAVEAEASSSRDVSFTLGAGCGERVLLVEDEESLRRLASLALQGLGYDVRQATSGADALRLVEQEGFLPDVLVTDVIMPQMGGQPLAARLRTIWPRLPVVFMSGYTDNTLTQELLSQPAVRFLQKPFSLMDLGAKVREVLTDASPLNQA